MIAIHGENLASGFMQDLHQQERIESCEGLVKSGSFNSELAEYMRVMGSNDGVRISTSSRKCH